MAKDRKAIEKRRQAKSMRQRTRAKDRRRQEAASSGPPADEFEMFRSNLVPPDLSPGIWNRRQILHDLEGRSPAQAIREYFDLFVDPESVEKGGPEANVQMEWGLFFWRLSTLPPEEREGALVEATRTLSDDPEKQAAFRENALEMIRTHEEMFPVLHAHLARLRAMTAADEAHSGSPGAEGSTGDAASLPVGPASDGLIEFARPLIEAAGDDEDALARALVTASILWEAAQAPLDRRLPLLRHHRETLLEADRAGFDEVARMMLRRYREIFAEDTDHRPVEQGSDRESQEPGAQPQEDGEPVEQDRAEDATTGTGPERGEDEDAAEERRGSLLGRWLRRGR